MKTHIKQYLPNQLSAQHVVATLPLPWLAIFFKCFIDSNIIRNNITNHKFVISVETYLDELFIQINLICIKVASILSYLDKSGRHYLMFIFDKKNVII